MASNSRGNLRQFASGFRTEALNLVSGEDQVLLVLTVIIGAIVGLVVVAFILVTENLGARLYPAGAAPWRRLVMPVIGALGSGYLLYKYFPNARGSGIPQTKAALFLRDGYISLRTVLGKFGCCAFSLASGIALGREGPAVQVAAGIASVLGRRLGLKPSSVKALVPVGAAAAVAAAFNTPIAAVLFTLEEVMGDRNAPVLGSVVVGSATSWIVLHLLLGDEPLFHVPAYQLVHPIEFLFYAVLGVAGGLVSTAFVKLLLGLRKRFLAMPQRTQWLQPVAGGLVVGILGWFVPDVLGVGYGVVGHALNGQMAIGAMALLVALKLIATTTCYSSGNAGGIFGPSLFLGAMMGGAFGGVAHQLLPDYTGSVGAYALVGMGALFAGIIRVPLTSVIMIFEITRDYSIIVPLMIANLISYLLAGKLQKEPIYEALLHQDGIHLPQGARAREALLTVGHAYRQNVTALHASDSITRAAESLDKREGAYPVIDDRGLRGMVTIEQIEKALADGSGDRPLETLMPPALPNEEINERVLPHVHPDHPLHVAIERLVQTGLPALPVVSRTDVRELKGLISLADITGMFRPGAVAEDAPQETKPVAMGLLVGILAVISALAIVGAFLNHHYRSQRLARAQQHYDQGSVFLRNGRYDEAVEQFRDALSSSPTAQYRGGLAAALEGEGQLQEAALYYGEALRDRPDDGPANLGLARVQTKLGHIDAALPHFQRAVYATWTEHPRENRAQALIEMVDALAKAGRTERARAEALALAADLPADPALERQAAALLTSLGLNEQAASVLRDVARQNPFDAAAQVQLGQALFALHQIPEAAKAFETALQADAGNAAAKEGETECARILALDPSLPGLTSAQRYERSRELLTQVVAAAGSCVSGGTAQEIQEALASRRRAATYSGATQENEKLALEAWGKRSAACAGDATPDAGLATLMSMLAGR